MSTLQATTQIKSQKGTWLAGVDLPVLPIVLAAVGLQMLIGILLAKGGTR
jgi:hypothetical protein